MLGAIFSAEVFAEIKNQPSVKGDFIGNVLGDDRYYTSERKVSIPFQYKLTATINDDVRQLVSGDIYRGNVFETMSRPSEHLRITINSSDDFNASMNVCLAFDESYYKSTGGSHYNTTCNILPIQVGNNLLFANDDIVFSLDLTRPTE